MMVRYHYSISGVEAGPLESSMQINPNGKVRLRQKRRWKFFLLEPVTETRMIQLMTKQHSVWKVISSQKYLLDLTEWRLD